MVKLRFIGGPLDGQEREYDAAYAGGRGALVAAGRHRDGDPLQPWAREAVYRLRDGRAIYDERATADHRRQAAIKFVVGAARAKGMTHVRHEAVPIGKRVEVRVEEVTEAEGSMVLVCRPLADEREAYVCLYTPGYVKAKAGDIGCLTMMPGGPLGAHWYFERNGDQGGAV